MDPSTALAIASWLIQTIFDKLADSALQTWASRVNLREEIESLLMRVNRMSVLLEAAKGREIGNKVLVKGLNELENLARAAEDLVDELDYFRLKAQIEGPSKQQVKVAPLSYTRQMMTGTFTNLASRFGFASPVDLTPRKDQGIKFDITNLASKIKKIITKFDMLGDSVMRGLNLESLHSISEEIQNVPLPTPQSQTSNNYTSVKFFGREKEMKEILDLFTNSFSGEVLSILAIVGNGGIGKTTLAKHVYNNFRVREIFELKIWVSLSTNFDEMNITRDILEHVTKDRYLGIQSLNMLQEILEEKLREINRFLLVLDDMWGVKDRERWETLLAPMRSEKNKGNVILITTRRKSLVGKIGAMKHIQLDGLEEDVFWSLFETCAFSTDKTENYENLELIGKEIAKQLKGYPLAAKSVGALLKRNHHIGHWKRVLDTNVWKYLQANDDIIPILTLNYSYLPFQLQRCFAYCSLFPKGYVFNSKELVYLWIAQGFIPSTHKKKRVEDIGNEFLNMLLNLGFFEKDYLKENYIMHDLMHDLAKMVSKDECLLLDGSNIKDIPTTIRHLSIVTKFVYNSDQQSKELQSSESFENQIVGACCSIDVKKLRTILLIGQYDLYFAKTFAAVFSQVKCLRVLCLNGMHYDISHLVSNFENLIHLRYLSINSSRIGKPLPRILRNLYHLQFLDISRCKHLSDLPEGIDNLINLNRLKAERELYSMIPNIGKLSSLQKLTDFRVRKVSGFEISQLRNLRELGGSLRISGLENVATKEEAYFSRLENKKHLRKLCLIWENEKLNGSKSAKNEVLEGLKPHNNLIELVINGFGGDILPTWFSTNLSLVSLESLRLENCIAWDILPPLGKLPRLKNLYLVNLGAVELIGYQFYGTGEIMGFPSLEHLEVSKMQILEKWVAMDGQNFFPCLKWLAITDCAKLKELPFEKKSWFHLLSEIIIEDCPSLNQSVSLPNTDKLTSLCVNRAGEFGYVNMRDSNLKIKHVGLAKTLRVLYQNLNNIVILSLKNCRNLTPLWDGFLKENYSIKLLKKLDFHKFVLVKEFSIESCLVSGRELSLIILQFPSLTRLSMQKCAQRDSSGDEECFLHISSLVLLEHLFISDCPNLRINEKERFIEIKSLKEVQIIDCPNFISSLTMLEEENCESSLLPSTVETLCLSDITDDLIMKLLKNLRALSELWLTNSSELTSLPLQSCNSIEKLVIKNCVKLNSVQGLNSFTSLDHLSIHECPNFLSNLSISLELQRLCNFMFLTGTIRQNIAHLKHLTIDLSSLGQSAQPTCLTDDQAEGFKALVSLKELKFINCMELESLPSVLHCLRNLAELWISNCGKIVKFPEKGIPISLKVLYLYRCSEELKNQCKSFTGIMVHT